MSLTPNLGLLHTISTGSLQTNNPYCYAQFDPPGGICDPSNPQASDNREVLMLDEPYHAYERSLRPVPEYPPSQKDWESYRGIFTQLYQVEEKPLKVVKELLETQYGFKATERMYKKRIKEWKIMKNYKREEKDAVSRALQRRTQAGKVSHQVMIRNQPVKFQRILRHLKASAGTTISRGSSSPWSSSEGSEIEVRTPDAESIVLDESTHRNFQANLLRRLSPGPGRPIFTHDDLGIAETLCWESVGYFESALSVHCGLIFHLTNGVHTASLLAESNRYSDARVILNNAFDELKNALAHQSPLLLLSLLRIICTRQGDRTPFKVRELYCKHAADLCRVYLGVRHPITVIVRSLPGASDKAQVSNTVLGSLLAVVLKKPGFGEAHDLPICLMRQQSETLENLGQFEEAEGTLRRALTICTTANETGDWRALNILLDLAWLSMTSLRNHRHAEVLIDTVLRDTVDEKGVTINPDIRSKALIGLARFAIIDGDLPKAEDLLQQSLEINIKGFGPKHVETICVARILEEILREQGKRSEANQLNCLYQLEDEYSL